MSLFQLDLTVLTQAEQSKARSRLTKLFNISSLGPICRAKASGLDLSAGRGTCSVKTVRSAAA